MKRRLPLLLVPVIPALVLFVLTARPARLYAESAPPPPACDAPDIVTCEGKTHGEPCTGPQGDGFCQPQFCYERDAGRLTTDVLGCRFAPFCASEQQVADCEGKAAGNACGSDRTRGTCLTDACPLADGGSSPVTACVAQTGPKQGSSGAVPSEPTPANPATADTPTAASDDGCQTAPGGGVPSGAAFGLMLAIGAFARWSSRRRA